MNASVPRGHARSAALGVASSNVITPRRRWWLIAALGVLSSAANAHHSFALFDQTKTSTIHGVVSRFDWTNPHIAVYVDLSGPPAQRYKVETGSVNAMSRQGWKAGDIKVGDKVAVVFHPLKNGGPGGLLVEIKTPSVTLKGAG